MHGENAPDGARSLKGIQIATGWPSTIYDGMKNVVGFPAWRRFSRLREKVVAVGFLRKGLRGETTAPRAGHPRSFDARVRERLSRQKENLTLPESPNHSPKVGLKRDGGAMGRPWNVLCARLRLSACQPSQSHSGRYDFRIMFSPQSWLYAIGCRFSSPLLSDALRPPRWHSLWQGTKISRRGAGRQRNRDKMWRKMPVSP